jgi:hypothetical protein
MGYRGKVKEQEQARALRARNRTLADIAQTLGVSKSSVSLWVRDVPFTPTLRLRSPHRRPHPAHEAKVRQIEELNRAGRERLGVLTEGALFAAGIALYAGEGSKTDGEVRFSNSDPKMVRLFCMWFRRFFNVDETRMHGRLYLHQGLDLSAAEAFWSAVANIPTVQFHKPYRAAPDPSIRRNKHQHGCFSVGYGCSQTHREVMGLVRALLSSEALPG